MNTVTKPNAVQRFFADIEIQRKEQHAAWKALTPRERTLYYVLCGAGPAFALLGGLVGLFTTAIILGGLVFPYLRLKVRHKPMRLLHLINPIMLIVLILFVGGVSARMMVSAVDMQGNYGSEALQTYADAYTADGVATLERVQAGTSDIHVVQDDPFMVLFATANRNDLPAWSLLKAGEALGSWGKDLHNNGYPPEGLLDALRTTYAFSIVPSDMQTALEPLSQATDAALLETYGTSLEGMVAQKRYEEIGAMRKTLYNGAFMTICSFGIHGQLISVQTIPTGTMLNVKEEPAAAGYAQACQEVYAQNR